jgi:tetratricopeptide (TPR) repeat protein
MIMWIRGIGSVLCAAFLAVILAACSSPSVSLEEDPAAYEDQVGRLQARLSERPDDAKALRDLGAIYMRTQRPARAYDALKKAFSYQPNDPKTLFYLGLASESVGKRQAALRMFKKYGEVSPASDYRTLMEGRYEWLVRTQVKEDMRDLLAREREIADQQVSERVVAVLPLEFQGADEQYKPLGRGLAAMVTTDLANVSRLKIVERIRLQALLDELELAQTEYVDASTAPRVGRMLGAGRLVGGSYYVTTDERLRMDVTLASIGSSVQFPDIDGESGQLRDLFRLQKQLVFRIIDGLDVQLTPRERAKIEEVPTENLQAFLAYCRGLEDEDRGDFGAAERHYGRSQTLDPGFEAPRQRKSKMEGLSAAGGSPQNAMASATQAQSGTTSIDLLDQRLRNMGFNVSLSPEPSREPAQESDTASPEALPPPPDPPPSDRSQN